jgi:hypothetical protein
MSRAELFLKLEEADYQVGDAIKQKLLKSGHLQTPNCDNDVMRHALATSLHAAGVTPAQLASDLAKSQGGSEMKSSPTPHEMFAGGGDGASAADGRPSKVMGYSTVKSPAVHRITG